MQQYLQIFEYEDHNRIRSVNIDGEIWFFALDVCKSLGIQNSGDAYGRLDKDDIGTTDGVDSKGRKIKSYIVSEFGLYDLILQSTKPEAKKFKRWITHEVIPQIRKTGAYAGRAALPAFVKRFNVNWHNVEKGYFSVISECFVRFYGRLEQVGYVLPDKGATGKEIRPDISVGRHFSTWLKQHAPADADRYKTYKHETPETVVDARQYHNDLLPLFIKFMEEEWIPKHSPGYLEERDPKALPYLPKLLGN